MILQFREVVQLVEHIKLVDVMGAYMMNRRPQTDNNSFSAHIPNWYWIKGLHDARIVEIYEIKTNARKDNRWISNEIVMVLDASQAMFDTSIKSIAFQNSKILTDGGLVPGNTWWYRDMLEKKDGKYQLEICYSNEKGKGIITIRFEDCIVCRE
jgi:hypothetical protein